MIGEWVFIQLFSPWTFTPFTPDETFWQLLHFLTPCLFCSDLGLLIMSIHNYHSTGGHLHAYNKLLHHPKVRYHWFTCVINKTKHWVYLPKFKMAAQCTHCIFGFKTRLFGIVFTNNDVMHAILVKKWSIYESFVRF